MSLEPAPATVVHLVERVRSPERTFGALREALAEGALVLDLSPGRLDAVSPLDPGDLPGADARWVGPADYAADLAEPSRRAYVGWVAEAGALDLGDGRSVRELFTYQDELSLWWITQTAQRDQDNSPYRWFFYAFAVIDRLLETGRVAAGAEWHLWAPDRPTADVLAGAVGDRGTVVLHLDAERPRPRGLGHVGRRYVLGPARQIASALRVAAATRRQRTARGQEALFGNARPSVLAVTVHPRSWRPASEEERFRDGVDAFDHYLGTMPWDLRDEGMGVAWLTAPLDAAEYRRWVAEGVERQTLPDATPWAALSARAARDLAAHHVRWLRQYRRLFERRRVQDRWTYRGAPMGHWIVRDYQNLLGGWANALLIQYEQQRRAAQALRPDAVVYRDEMYVSGRIVSAAFQGVSRRVGVQHGIINAEATVYTFDRRELDPGAGPADYVRTCPVPDVFATFGEHTREFLAGVGGYDPARVVPTGGVRHDELVRRFGPGGADRADRRAVLRRQLGLPTDAPVVLLCTQRRAEAGAWFDLVVSGLAASGEDAFVAVKTHHYHGGETDVRRVAEAHGWTRYALYDGHTYPLIGCADVVVGGPSTIILESRLLGVPAVSISGSSGYEVYPYLAESVGEVVGSAGDMAEVLSRLLSGPPVGGDGEDPRRSVLRRHLWNDDAVAAKRLARLVAGQVQAHE